MSESYEIYRFRYKRKDGLTMVVFARTKETADRVVALENANSADPWKPCFFGFRKRVRVTTPPYDLEREQLRVAEAHASRRVMG